MKILPIEKIREADAYTIKHEPITDIDLMERAATELFEWIVAKTEPDKNINIVCGLGNNGGDGFALARLLKEVNYNVRVFILWYTDKMSPSCKTNYDRVRKIKTIQIVDIKEHEPIPEFADNSVIVDAIFGSGLTRPINGFVGDLVESINKSNAVVISIDAPSGFYCDMSNSDNEGSIIHADYTLTFQFPKFGFLFPENDQYVGHWEVFHIGLHPDYIEQVEVKNYFLTVKDCKGILKSRNKFDHKGKFGHGLLIAGGYEKMGAAVLSTKAGLKAGAGLITTHIPGKGNDIIQTAVPAAMVNIDENEKSFSQVPDMAPYNAIAVGPGIGQEDETSNALKLLIQNSSLPIIFDADAINILAENKTWISFIPKQSVFTPHPKEFERLIGTSSNNFEQNQMQRDFSIKYQVYVILKGAHTVISCPDGKCYFNSTGNPGMATAGSGDVLTGILLGLKAQGYSSFETCLLGVFLHGLAGDIAFEKWGLEALTAGNITHNLGKAFKTLR